MSKPCLTVPRKGFIIIVYHNTVYCSAQVSIPSTFYACLLCLYFSAKKLQSRNETREKLHKALSYEKFVGKMLMKLTSELNWITNGLIRRVWLEPFVLFWCDYWAAFIVYCIWHNFEENDNFDETENFVNFHFIPL